MWLSFFNPLRGSLLWGVLASLGLSACNSFFYLPDRVQVLTPFEAGLKYEQVTITAPQDEPKLSAWLLPADRADAPTILFLHGNAGNISTHLGSVFWLPARGFNVLMLDYRGYGGSAGSATVSGVHTDIGRAIEYLRTRKELSSHGMLLYGQSLGATMALTIAAKPEYQHDFACVIAESPFASYRQIAYEKARLTWLTSIFAWPVRWSISDAYAPLEHVAGLQGQHVLLISGDRDVTVPLAHTQAIYDALKHEAEYWQFPEAGHLGIFTSEASRERLMQFLARCVSASSPQ